MAQRLAVANIKKGMPTVEEARALLMMELKRARQQGASAVKIIHGYGSSGQGGSLRIGLRKSLRKRVKEKLIQSYVAGEDWDIFDPVVQDMIDACPELERDPDLRGHNEGITIVKL